MALLLSLMMWCHVFPNQHTGSDFSDVFLILAQLEELHREFLGPIQIEASVLIHVLQGYNAYD